MTNGADPRSIVHACRKAKDPQSSTKGASAVYLQVPFCHALTHLWGQVHGYRHRVLFRQACDQVPKDAIMLEIGPHSILKSLIKQCRPDLEYVPTLKKVIDLMFLKSMLEQRCIPLLPASAPVRLHMSKLGTM